MTSNAPKRAVRLTLRLDADDLPTLASALRQMADHAERNELTIGISGGSSSGSIYELIVDPLQTHERYFQQVREYLTSIATTELFK